MYVAIVVACEFYSRGAQTSFTHAVNCIRFCFWRCLWVFVCVWYISRAAERTCAKFTGKMCLVPRSDKFECQGQRSRSPGTKRHFSTLSAACVRFMFGKTFLASSFVFLLWRASSEQYYWISYYSTMLDAIKHVADDNFVFQQGSEPAHRACNTVHLLARNPQFHLFQAVTATAQSCLMRLHYLKKHAISARQSSQVM